MRSLNGLGSGRPEGAVGASVAWPKLFLPLVGRSPLVAAADLVKIAEDVRLARRIAYPDAAAGGAADRSFQHRLVRELRLALVDQFL